MRGLDTRHVFKRNNWRCIAVIMFLLHGHSVFVHLFTLCVQGLTMFCVIFRCMYMFNYVYARLCLWRLAFLPVCALYYCTYWYQLKSYRIGCRAYHLSLGGHYSHCPWTLWWALVINYNFHCIPGSTKYLLLIYIS